MIQTRKTIIYLFLHFAITAWPFLTFLASEINHKEASLINFSMLFLVFWGLGLFVSEIARKILRVDRERILIVYIIFIISFFNYNYYQLFMVKFHVPKYFYLFIVLFLGVSYGAYRFSKFATFQKAVQVFVFIIFSFSLIENMTFYFKKEPISLPQKKNNKFSFNFKENPNVYFIVLDTYPRHSILKSKTNFDNSKFINFFKSKGFIVAEKSYSNYPDTWPSLSATFKMDYIKRGDIVWNDVVSPQKPVIDIFKQNGYEIGIIPSHYEPFQGRNVADFIIYPVVSFISSVTCYNFLKNTPFSILLNYLRPLGYFGDKEIKKFTDLKLKEKNFIFIHFIHLHDFAYDKNCKVSAPSWSGGEMLAFVDNIKCFNPFVENSIGQIIENDPQAIIIVQGDHGPWYWREPKSSTFQDFQEGYSIFSAVYIPGLDKDSPIAKYLSDAPSPVNNFRIIFSYLSNTPVELLPDYAYADNESKKDLTHFRLQGIAAAESEEKKPLEHQN
jgi:hypothetical protein